jgi:hypothetical protein
MAAYDDVDEDELALAMSTELTEPVRSIPIRRARSFTSVEAAAAEENRYISVDSLYQCGRSPGPEPPYSTLLRAKFIKLRDKSSELLDQDESDGLWASSVTVSDPSIVRGTEKQSISAATGYVGPSPHL